MSCPRCGHAPWACVCTLSWKERLTSIQLHVAATPTRTRRNYWDQEAVDETFGEDAEEIMMEDTGGLGTGHLTPDGGIRIRRGDSEEVIAPDEYLRGPEHDDDTFD